MVYSNDSKPTGTYTNDTEQAVHGGLLFDGASGQVLVDDNVAIQNIFDNGGSISCWIKPITLGEGSLGRIIEKSISGIGWTVFMATQSGSTSKMVFFHSFSTTNGQWTTTNAVLTLNEWNFVVITYNSSSTTNDPLVYVNGVLVTTVDSTVPSGTRVSDVTRPLYIGNNPANTRTFNGYIDDVRLYTKILTATEIINQYAEDLIPKSNLVLQLLLNEGAGTTVNDTSASGLTGTITNATFTVGSDFVFDSKPSSSFSNDTKPTTSYSNDNKPSSSFSNDTKPSFYLEYTPTNSTKGYWKLNGNGNDSSGNAHDGTETSMTYSDYNGYFLKYGIFNGSTSKILIPHHSDFSSTSAVTLSAWIYPLALTNGAGFSIITKCDSPATLYMYFRIQGNGVNTGILHFNGTFGATTINTNQWYHVAAVYDGSIRYVYLNGVEDGRLAVAGLTPGVGSVGIGVLGDLNSQKFNGYIDEAVWEDRAWSASEILNYYNTTRRV